VNKAQFHVTVTVNKVLCIHSSDEVGNYITTLISTDQQGCVLNLTELFIYIFIHHRHGSTVYITTT